ncbi:dTMP kinase [Marinicella rhabdoformis]|uniref:dTMP kinase n=1 Tax=Marinicella rhabdoformis TaxID=2580566 RepID=UPI0012AEBB52|nr:dTMP kinase [Marinicella rhabdoformis]
MSHKSFFNQIPAQFISLEGSEGAGKSSALSVITSILDSWSIPYITTREPGGEESAEKIRDILLYANHLDAQTELLLMFAARNEHVVKTIRPALAAGTWVVSDRFVDASFAYQGGGRSIDNHVIGFLEQLTVGDTVPDLTLYLDVTPEVGLSRAAARSEKDRIEKEDMTFFQTIRTAYLARLKAYPKRIKHVDADVNIDQVAEQIKRVMNNFKEQL